MNIFYPQWAVASVTRQSRTRGMSFTPGADSNRELRSMPSQQG